MSESSDESMETNDLSTLSQSNATVRSNENTLTRNSIKTTLTILDGKFLKFHSESSNGKSVVFTCEKCSPNQVKVKGCPNSTSNFLSHLKRKHGDQAVAEYQDYAKQVKLIQKRRRIENVMNKDDWSRKISQVNFENDLVNFFIHSMIPLNAVEDPFFIKMLDNLNISNHGINVISRRTLSRKINDFHTEQISESKLILQEVEYVCTVVDIWSSRKRSFLGVTAHWIDADLNRQSKTLACRRFSGVHNYERIAMLLDDIHAEFNLNHEKVVATVTDNGSNFVKAFKEFGVSIDSFDSVDSAEEENAISDEDNDADCTYEEDPPLRLPAYMEVRENANIQEQNINLPSHFRCAAHTLNLCATTDANRILQEVDENEDRTSLADMHRKTMKKCNTLWNAAGRPKSAEIIQSVLGHTLSKPKV